VRHDYCHRWQREGWSGPFSELLAHNYEVASVDLVRPPDSPVPFSRVELTDFGQTMTAFSQVDDRICNVTEIVHLAAIPAPGLARHRND
jgi:hypothetical protein